MSEYTTTPRLGLIKPNYKKDSGKWGDHLNGNADILDLHYGNWNAGYVNVLDYGADPTGQVDSSDAINEAASQMGPNGHRLGVYLPTGNYALKKQILLTDGQTFRGDGEGSTYLLIFDSFDPNASSIILCTGSVIDPGPTIRDIGFWFIQPNDLSSRSTMKPLGAGGTSYTPGGTGVQYPWAISVEPASAGHGQAGRIQINHVAILNAWNGIDADNACFWIDGLKISAYNIGIAIGGTIANPVADWAHLSDIEFWNFGMPWPGQLAIYMDGQTVALRIGAQNGLTAQNISCFQSQVNFTSDARGGWFSFTNLAMDSPHATINVAGAFFLQIANVYTSGGGIRPQITVTDCQVTQITNWYSHSSDVPYGMLVVTGGVVNVDNAYLIYYTPTTDCIGVAGGGILRINNSTIIAAGAATAWSRPLINQYDTGVLQVDNLHMPATAGSTGVGVQMNGDNRGNYLGSVELAAGWRNAFVGSEGAVGHYGNMRVFRPDNDPTSLQCGAYGFNTFGATTHASTAYGWGSLSQHQDAGNSNTAFGNIAGYGVTTGSLNCFFGAASGYGTEGGGPIIGSNNSCYGASAGRKLTSGNQNVFLGAFTGQSITTGSNNIFIGYGMDAGAAQSNSVNIGGVISVTGTNVVASSVTTLQGRLNVKNLPTSATGLIAGDVWRNGTVLNIV